VGCGCRGRSLAGELVAAGHAVRGTTRDPARVAEIEAAGAEGVVADPDRLATLLPRIEGISVICWLLASASGEGLHRERLASLLERLVDAPVRGFVYEAAGSMDPELLAEGAAAVRAFNETFHVPIGLIEADPGDPEAWIRDALGAVQRVLG
jgi:nucleoside-diphosphate-sugar epimerase